MTLRNTFNPLSIILILTACSRSSLSTPVAPATLSNSPTPGQHTGLTDIDLTATAAHVAPAHTPAAQHTTARTSSHRSGHALQFFSQGPPLCGNYLSRCQPNSGPGASMHPRRWTR